MHSLSAADFEEGGLAADFAAAQWWGALGFGEA
jgi:hypothetical protein